MPAPVKLLAIFFVIFASSVASQESTDARDKLLVIYDSSNSMWGELGDTSRKNEAGRNALSSYLAGDLGDREIGFRICGHCNKDDCRETELLVPFSGAQDARTGIVRGLNH